MNNHNTLTAILIVSLAMGMVPSSFAKKDSRSTSNTSAESRVATNEENVFPKVANPFLSSATSMGMAPESPFHRFRDLLELSDADFEKAFDDFVLTNCPPNLRGRLKRERERQKVLEYYQMSPEVRERSLQILDLMWYLLSGVGIQPSGLDTYIEPLSENYCQIIRERVYRECVRQKVLEYRQMPPEVRERSLQILDLRWYLLSGVGIQPSELDTYVESLPENYRQIMRERLERWFALNEQQRTNILANIKKVSFPPNHNFQNKGGKLGMAHRKFDAPPSVSHPKKQSLPPNQPPPPSMQNGQFERAGFYGGNVPRLPYPTPFPQSRAKWSTSTNNGMPPPLPPGLKPINKMPHPPMWMGGMPMPPKKFTMEERTWLDINNFFSTNDKDKQRIISCLPEVKQEKVWRTIRMLDQLSPVERQRSLQILLEISEMPEAERQIYIQNAERWQSLSREEKVFFRVLFLPKTTGK